MDHDNNSVEKKNSLRIVELENALKQERRKNSRLEEELSRIQNSRSWVYTRFIRERRLPNPFYLLFEKKQYKCIKGSSFFNESFYTKENPSILTEHIDPVLHYLRYGAMQGKDPSINFSTNFYMRMNPDVNFNKYNPLYHFLKFGQQMGSLPLPAQRGYHKPRTAVAKQDHSNVKISIIIPVHNALQDLKSCLHSLKDSGDLLFEIIIIDDCSNKETKDFLNKTAEENSLIQLYTNSENLRFTRSSNIGLKAAKGDIVVLLNSDTIAPANWLAKVLNCFTASDSIGIAGPLSNAASWQTIPFEPYEIHNDWKVQDLPEGLSVDQMDRLLDIFSDKEYPHVPSVNGFCFAIRKKVFEKIGFLDEKHFPCGFGEEDDFCIRAANQGFKIAVIDNLFVYHGKSKSYSHEIRQEYTHKNQTILKTLHGKKMDRLVDLWERQDFQKILTDRFQEYLNPSKGKPFVVYTAIFGDYDHLQDPQYVNEDTDYICFTDNLALESSVYSIKLVNPLFSETVRNARMLKLLPHLFLPGYTLSVWVDGSTQIRGRNIHELFTSELMEIGLAVHSHLDNECVYQEAEDCLWLGKGSPDKIKKQIQFYTQQDFPQNQGMVETAQLIRLYRKDINNFNERWWDLLNTYSSRDQLSFPFAAWELQKDFIPLEGNQWLDSYFKNYLHRIPSMNYSSSSSVTMIMLVRDQLDLTLKSIHSLLQNTSKRFKLKIIDNSSSQETVFALKSLADKSEQIEYYRNDENLSYSKANNRAIMNCTSDYVLLINNDIEVIQPKWLDMLCYYLDNDQMTAAAGPILLYPDYTIQSASILLECELGQLRGAKENRSYFHTHEVNACTAACLLVRTSLYKQLDGLDEKFIYGQEDIDFCLRIREKSYKIMLVSESEVLHHESATRRYSSQTENNRVYLQNKWKHKSLEFLNE